MRQVVYMDQPASAQVVSVGTQAPPLFLTGILVKTIRGNVTHLQGAMLTPSLCDYLVPLASQRVVVDPYLLARSPMYRRVR